MKDLPQIRCLLDGESPLSVFRCQCMHEARCAFNQLRRIHDFAYWAITEYRIRDINDADSLIPLRLNIPQLYCIDIMLKHRHNRRPTRYAITKSFPRCGLTTCVQAYIIWLQTYHCRINSFTCSSSRINLNPLKADICRHLGGVTVPSGNFVFLPNDGGRAFFNTYRNPDYIRGITLGYVHLADMSKWKDSEGSLSSRVYNAATGGTMLAYYTLVVCEGNVPRPANFHPHMHRSLPRDQRMSLFRTISNNPYFLNFVTFVSSGKYDTLVHIDLDAATFPDRRLRIPLLAR